MSCFSLSHIVAFVFHHVHVQNNLTRLAGVDVFCIHALPMYESEETNEFAIYTSSSCFSPLVMKKDGRGVCSSGIRSKKVLFCLLFFFRCRIWCYGESNGDWLSRGSSTVDLCELVKGRKLLLRMIAPTDHRRCLLVRQYHDFEVKRINKSL